jgi:hypothetical protein
MIGLRGKLRPRWEGRRMHGRLWPTALTGLATGMLVLSSVTPGTAMVRLDRTVLTTLASSAPGRAARIEEFPLDDGSTVTLELERFDVWAPGARIVERGDGGERLATRPATRYFRGRVAGAPGSWVFLASDETVRGFVTIGARLYAVAPDRDAYRDVRPGAESLVRRIDRELDSPLDRPLFRCDNEGLDLFPPDRVPIAIAQQGLLARVMSNGKTYQATIAIDTDYELYQRLGSTSAVSSYVSDLVAASSAIYHRDVQTTLRLGNTYVYSTASDPWSATSTVDALYEVGDYWHANRPTASVPRTTVHFLSAKNMGGGVSWLGVLCQNDFSQGGHWGGAYGVSASLDGEFSTTNPGLYWDILCFTHELGHNFAAQHTECYDPPVDTCTPCSSFSCTGPVPSGGGTIMSYCHACSGGYNNITLYFGFSGQSSQVVLDDMRAHVEYRAASVPSCIPELLQLIVSRNGTGSGTVTSSPAGISCGATCSTLFAKDSSVALTATPAGGSTFAGWSGACAGTGSCVVTINATKNATATFSETGTCTITVSGQTVTTAQTHESCDGIYAGPSLAVVSPGDLTLRAAVQVILRNGVSADAGARLTIGLDPLLAGT